MATEVYKVIKDISLPRAVRELPPRFEDGPPRYETTGQNYPVGSYVKADQISPPVLERVEDGELEDFLEALSGDEAEAALAVGDLPHLFGTFIPEHEVEQHLLSEYGHTTVPRSQVLELRDSNVEESQELAAEIADDPDRGDVVEGPGEVASITEVSLGEVAAVLPVEEEEDVVVPPGTEQPPGIPVGNTEDEDEDTPATAKRSRRKKSSQASTSSSETSE